MRSRRNPTDTLGGFTIVELLVVMLILAIVAAIVVPSVGNTSDMRATAATRLIAADLQYAQNMAVTHQEPVGVEFFPDGEYYQLSNTSGPLIHPMTKTAYTVNFASQDEFGKLDIVSADFDGGSKVTFDELGAPDNSGSVTVKSGVSTYRIDVAAATGKVTVTYVAP